ncbi:hypothetical protein [Exiguobacterium acetylicum]|uniref:hypothetical protein n=1 Tax=Exiguobacterium TaxID=33986 RepID=UPI00347E5CD4
MWKKVGTVLLLSTFLAGCSEISNTVDDAKQQVNDVKNSVDYAGELQGIAKDTAQVTSDLSSSLNEAATKARESTNPEQALDQQIEKLKENGTIDQFNQELDQIDQRLAGLENPPQELQNLSAKLEQFVNQSEDITRLLETDVSLDTLNRLGIEQAGKLQEAITNWTSLLDPFTN